MPATPAAENLLGVFDRLSGPDIKVYQRRCVRVRNRNAACTACLDACTSGAISCDGDGRIAVDPARCIGCGTCATACPTCALEAHNPDDDRLLAEARRAMAANGGTVVFACVRQLDEVFGHCDESKLACVACAGRLEESLLVGLAYEGARNIQVLGCGCVGCEHEAGAAVAREVAQSANAILAAWGSRVRVGIVDRLPASVMAEGVFGTVDARGLNRREERPAAQADATTAQATAPAAQADALAAHFQKVGRDGTLEHFVPNRRGRLLATLSQMGRAPEDVPVATRLWGQVCIDPAACGSCRMCTVFCPTGSLRVFDDRRTATQGIEHEPGRCVACGTCEAICPHQALTLVHEVYPSDLYDGHTERFEVAPREVPLGRPDTIVRTMRKLLSDSKFVSQA